MATSIFVNGQDVSVPGSYSEVDASALDVPLLGATGIVAIVGKGVGGRPFNEITDVANEVPTARNSGLVKRLFREGDLRELGAIMFKPAPTAERLIPSGAAQLVFMKTNRSTKSSRTFVNADGNALVLESYDWGQFTTQTKVTIADGTTGGKKVTVVLESTTEIFDDVGVDGKATLIYAGGSDGATTATVTVSSTAFSVNFTRVDAGDDTGWTQAAAGSSLEVVSDDAGDTTQSFTLYGLDGDGVPATETVTLNGTNAVPIPGTWDLETAVLLDSSADGTVTLRIAGGGATVKTLATTVLSAGLEPLDMPVSGALTIVSSGASTKKVVLRGLNNAGQAIAEAVTLNGTTPVALTAAFVSFTQLENGNVEAAQSTTIAGKMINATFASYPTLKRLEDLIESKSADFTWVSLAADAETYLVSRLDRITAQSILSPTTLTIRAVLDDIVTQLNAKSRLVTAERDDDGTGAPTNIGPVFLTGGHEGDADNPGVPTATNQDYFDALDLLKQVHVETIIFDTDSAAIHAAGDAHCAEMCGIGRDERDMVVAAAVGETKAQLKARILALNSRHARLVGQEVLLFDSDGVETWQPPKYLAALVAAAQAGAPVTEPLTEKQFNVRGIRQNSEWNPKADAIEMVNAHLWFLKFEGGVFRNVRNITTHKADNNLAYIEASSNRTANRAVYLYRTRLQAAVGRPGFGGTINDAKVLALKELDRLLNEDKLIKAYTPPAFTLVGDVLEDEVGMAIVNPVNFVFSKISLFDVALVA